MSTISCPQCRADLDDDLRESLGRAECPFCGADVPELATAAVPPDEVDSDAARLSLPPLPAKSVIQIVQVTPERRVFYIPGGRSGSIGCFALLWNGFMAVFTGGMASAFWGGNQGDITLPMLIAFLSVFWLVGLGMAIWWFKTKFERLFVMIEPQRIVIQRVLFGRKRIDETVLHESSRAELVESYRSNDEPVYRVEVAGTNRAAKFATSLERDEKNWLVDRINEFLHPAGISPTAQNPAKFCFQCGASLKEVEPDKETGSRTCPDCGQTIAAPDNGQTPAGRLPSDINAEIDAAELAQPADVTIDEQHVDHLQFHLPICSRAGVAWVVAAISIAFGAIFIGIACSSLFGGGNIDLFDALVCFPFMIGGLMPISIGLAALRGRITVDLTRERIKARYHLGLLGKSKEIPTDQITDVTVMAGMDSDTRIRGRRPTRPTSDAAACVVKSGAQTIPLTLIHDKPTARYVAQLVRRQLHEMGVQLS